MTKRLVVLLACVFCVSGFSFADDWHHSWNVGAKPEFEFRSNDAGIDVVGRSGNTIEASVETRGYKISDNDVRITERQNGDRVVFEVHVAPRHMQFGVYSLKVQVTVPENTTLRINTGDGHIKVDGVKADQRLQSGDGSIETTRVTGDLWAHSGDGHIRADGQFAHLDLATSDGHIDASIERGSKMAGTWDMHTGDGSVRVDVPSDFAADLDIDTGDGHIQSDLNVTVQGSMSPSKLRGTLNGGGPTLRIHTGDGSVHLRRS